MAPCLLLPKSSFRISERDEMSNTASNKRLIPLKKSSVIFLWQYNIRRAAEKEAWDHSRVFGALERVDASVGERHRKPHANNDTRLGYIPTEAVGFMGAAPICWK